MPNFTLISRIFLSVAFIVIVIGSYVIAAQTSFSGEWRADVKSEDSDKIYLSLERRSASGDRNQNGSSYKFSDLQGLTRAQAESGGAVKFSIVREAGKVDFEGSFQNGKGTGTFRFTSNPKFVADMKSRGFDFEQDSKERSYNRSRDEGDELENRLFTATMINVTTALADDILSANFGTLDVDDLFKAAIFNVDSKFMREMKATGFPNLKFDDLVKARIFKIDAEYVSQVGKMGFNNESFETLVKMRIFKITPDFIAEVKKQGFADLDIEDLVKMKIFNIDGAFIQQARADGVPLDVQELVQKRIGVWRKR